MPKTKKQSVSINIHVGSELFEMLSEFCKITGQSKTIAIERAIKAYCSPNQDSDQVQKGV